MTISENYDFSSLNSSDKLTLIGELWDSVEQEKIVTPQWHLEELEKISALEATGEVTYSSWEDVKKRIVSKYDL
jgi:hypothetical protein